MKFKNKTLNFKTCKDIAKRGVACALAVNMKMCSIQRISICFHYYNFQENEKRICFVIRFRIVWNFVSNGGTHTHTHGKNVETTLLRRRNVNTLHKCPSTVVLLVTSENEFITLVSYVRVTDRLGKQHRPVWGGLSGKMLGKKEV